MENDERKSKRVTLNEMYDIFMGNAYKDFRERTDLTVKVDGNGNRYVEYIIGWFSNEDSPLLYKHIAAEQLIQCPNYRMIEWPKVSIGNGFALLKLLELCQHPLVWKDASEYKNIVIEGRVAEEEYERLRYMDKYEIFEYIKQYLVLRFADELPICEKDTVELRYVKGMHIWTIITSNIIDQYYDVLNGATADLDRYCKAKSYDAGTLRANLNLIAKERDGKRAAKILRMLQEEWPKIKVWKTGFDTMTEDDIRQFEDGLFHGFDDVLAEWEAEGQTPIEENPKSENPNAKFFNLSNFEYDVCEKELIRILTDSKWKSDVCRELSRSATAGYFNLKGMTNEEKANAINPWVAKVKKTWIFTGEDFRQAGRPRKRKE